jgi:single-stranded-DNA-specific exonuclease
MAVLKKRGFCQTLEEVISVNSGIDADELLKPKWEDIKGVDKVALKLLEYVNGYPMLIVGDYDADGILSSACLTLLITEMGGSVDAYIPRRFSDGYGVSDTILEDNASWYDNVVVVDNGISFDFGKWSDDKNIIIIDHHLPKEGVVHTKETVLDPWVTEESFTGFCATALVYKIAEQVALLGKCSVDTLETIKALAGIATVTDVMPLISENRDLVKHALRSLDEGLFKGIRKGKDPFKTEDIGFLVGPVLNASGRLYDDGGQTTFDAVMKSLNGKRGAFSALLENNQKRKDETNRLIAMTAGDVAKQTSDIIIVSIGGPMGEGKEGLMGLLAAKVAENKHRPCLCCCEVEPGIYKGSARTYGDYNLMSFMDDNKNLFIRYGGHAGAAGFSIDGYNLSLLKVAASEVSLTFPNEDVVFFDLEIQSGDIPEILLYQEKFEPFGEGNPAPVYKVAVHPMTRNELKGGHVKLDCGEYDVLGFSMAKDIPDLTPLTIACTLSYNYFMGNKRIQATIIGKE